MKEVCQRDKGYVFTCPNGHEIVEIIEDIHYGELNWFAKFGKWRQTPIVPGTLYPKCEICGEIWWPPCTYEGPHVTEDDIMEKVAEVGLIQENGSPSRVSQYGIEYTEWCPDLSLDSEEKLFDKFIKSLKEAKETGAAKIVWRQKPKISTYYKNGVRIGSRVYARFHFMSAETHFVSFVACVS